MTFRAEWPESGFPGNAQCVLTLANESGEVVGESRFDFTSGTNGGRSLMIVSVSREPVSGAGSCRDDPNEIQTGAGYLFTGPTKISAHRVPYQLPGLPGRNSAPLTEIEFDVTWEDPDQNPGFRTCYLYVTRTDGAEDPPTRYDILASGTIVFDVKGEPQTIATARVTCGPLEE